MDPNQLRAAPRTQTSSLVMLSVFLLFIAIVSAMALISSPLSSSFKNSFSIMHQVPKEHVGVYWRGKALAKTITKSGFYIRMHFLTQYELVQVTLQAEVQQVTNIPYGTKGGVRINFEKIQVVNRLYKEYVHEILLNYGTHYNKTWIHDEIHHHINCFCPSHSLQQVYIDDFNKIGGKIKEALQVDCTRYSSGIEIIVLHVTKPAIPHSIKHNFEQLEEEHIKMLIAIKRQKVAEKEAETSKKMAISEAKENATTSKIFMEQTLLENEGFRSQQEIENQMYLQHERCRAGANIDEATKEAKENRLTLALKFIELFLEIAKRSSRDDEFLSWLLQGLQLSARLVFQLLQNML